MSKAIGYAVLPIGGYADTAADYVYAPTRLDVEAQLADLGWMENPGVYVYKITKGETFESVVASLVVDPDPYPDWFVGLGERGGKVWSNA